MKHRVKLIVGYQLHQQLTHTPPPPPPPASGYSAYILTVRSTRRNAHTHTHAYSLSFYGSGWRRWAQSIMAVERDPKKVDFTKDGNYKLYPDDPLSEESRKEFLAREPTQFFDPCKDASKMSMACLERNNYDRSKCKPYFEAYRDCLKTWRENRKK